ncbi:TRANSCRIPTION ELONGATION FACTOR (TFIIS) FAMILY PROTEIN-RELATED [Salix viminalis]|uniref:TRANSCRIPTION ELONGATION FACTOR (TFIIS) FAMILY PROTEIN-RELATED n=1 Tax=Salix viminalis TaxID=40686 RepID=A0A9Q0ZE00_SALVM|nr:TRANSCRIPTION ELONGATION FACTOR (TFIIS) FAMILY PROTEIN-RELATED [Salix viminalis]
MYLHGSADVENNAAERTGMKVCSQETQIVFKKKASRVNPENILFPDIHSIVSASRPAAACGSPAAPSHFEGTPGWRGPAATNAFRPSSPRKTSNGDKTVEIDLIVAEDGEKVVNFISSGQSPASPAGFQFRGIFLEVGSRRSACILIVPVMMVVLH